MEKTSDLAKLKGSYELLKEKYGLPSFTELNENFLIEKVAESETDFILRGVRTCITEKFFNYLRFIESLLNPNNAPMFVFAMTKTLGIEEREKLANLYKKISKLELDLVESDLNYSEEKEAIAIKKYWDMWAEIRKELADIIDVIKKKWDNKTEDNGKGYFG